ncbi:MAG: hypothetical protein VX690_04995 [Pseudomonadota bacterium]|jgi:serine/threonine protein kinase|nr:hypothetical protein [Pseudomonadota bacterium]
MTSDERVNKLSFDQTQNIRNWLQTHDPADTLGSGYQASIYLYKGPSEKYIIKKAFGSMIRKKLSEASIRHEEQVYRKLIGIPGIPKCFGLLDTKYLILEYIPGGSYRTLEHELNDKDHFFSNLLSILNDMHAAGVAHGDLKRKDNILVGPNQKPFIIDFGVSVLAEGRGGFIFNAIRQADRNAWIKHKYRGYTSHLSTKDIEIFKPMLLEKMVKIIRVVWQMLTLKRWRKRRKS